MLMKWRWRRCPGKVGECVSLAVWVSHATNDAATVDLHSWIGTVEAFTPDWEIRELPVHFQESRP